MGEDFYHIVDYDISAETITPASVGTAADLKDPDNAKIEIVLPSYRDLGIDYTKMLSAHGIALYSDITGGQAAVAQAAQSRTQPGSYASATTYFPKIFNFNFR